MGSPRAYRLIIEPEATDGIETAFRWIQTRSPAAASAWREGMYAAIRSLSLFPARCSLAPEAASFDLEIRQLHYGKRGGVYRILFVIKEDSDTVDILHVRHSAQRRLSPRLDEDEDGDD